MYGQVYIGHIDSNGNICIQKWKIYNNIFFFKMPFTYLIIMQYLSHTFWNHKADFFLLWIFMKCFSCECVCVCALKLTGIHGTISCLAAVFHNAVI